MKVSGSLGWQRWGRVGAALAGCACHGAPEVPAPVVRDPVAVEVRWPQVAAVPEIVDVSPAPDAIDVGLDDAIRIRFTLPMDQDSVEAALTVTSVDAHDVVWRDGAHEIEVRPHGGLASDAVVTVTVAPSAHALTGRALGGPRAWTFTTEDRTPPRASAVTPHHLAVAVPLDAVLSVVFDEPMDPSVAPTVTLFPPLGGTWRWAGPSRLELVPPTGLFPGRFHLVAVDGVVDLAGNRLEAPVRFEFLAQVGTRLPAAPRPPAPSGWGFVDVAEEVGLTDHPHVDDTESTTVSQRLCAGVIAGDLDGDHFVDFVPDRGSSGPYAVLHNLGGMGFAHIPDALPEAPSGVLECGGIAADWSGDGALDLLLFRLGGSPLVSLANRGDGTFADVTVATGIVVPINTFSGAVADYDRDGDLDVALAHWFLTGEAPADPRYLWQNQGTGRFVDASAAAGLYGIDLPFTLTPVFSDFDADGWPDLLFSADFGSSAVYRNQGDGTFAATHDPALTDENGMGSAIGDYDNDGDLDWFVTSIFDARGPADSWGATGNRLYRNEGDGTFADVTEHAGVREGGWGWGTCFADFDLDGHLDLFHTNGYDKEGVGAQPFLDDPNRLFVGNGDGTFTERAAELGLAHTGQGRGVSCVDYDRDGDVDVYVSNRTGVPTLFRNDLDGGHFLNVRLRGRAPNTEGIGARITVVTATGSQVREVRAGGSYNGQDPAEAVFGLAAEDLVRELRVGWPSGVVQRYPWVPVDRFVVVEEP